MGLADLKKSSTQSKPPASPAASIEDFIDDFIEDADRYAMGIRTQSAEVISIASRMPPQTATREASDLERLQALLKQRQVTSSTDSPRKQPTNNAEKVDANKANASKRGRHFRKATFSLSETNIGQLAKMTQDSDLCKSALIRLLIENHYLLSPHERRKLEQLVKTQQQTK